MSGASGADRWPRRGGVYVLLTEAICAGPILEVAEACLEGGARALQLREKDRGVHEIAESAARLLPLAHRFGAVLMINDRPDVADASGADHDAHLYRKNKERAPG